MLNVLKTTLRKLSLRTKSVNYNNFRTPNDFEVGRAVVMESS